MYSRVRAQGPRASGIYSGPGPTHAGRVCSCPVSYTTSTVWTPLTFTTRLAANQHQGNRGAFLQEDDRSCSHRETSERHDEKWLIIVAIKISDLVCHRWTEKNPSLSLYIQKFIKVFWFIISWKISNWSALLITFIKSLGLCFKLFIN